MINELPEANGAYIYRRRATPQLFYVKSRPPLGWFQQPLIDGFANKIQRRRRSIESSPL